jgi:cell division protease FtsH
MRRRWPALGAQTFGRPRSAQFLSGSVSFDERNFSETTAQRINAEVSRVLKREHARAMSLLEARRVTLDAVAAANRVA